MHNYTDISGQRFGRLVAVEMIGKDKQRNAIWLCKCDCGNEITTRGSSLRAGVSKSCGCLNAELAGERIKAIRTSHGQFGTRLYGVWAAMLRRCNNPHTNVYHLYGARGVTVCEEWREFPAFQDWALANGYDENAPRGACTLDRIDVNGNYSPENCRWVSMKVQNNNRRNNIKRRTASWQKRRT